MMNGLTFNKGDNRSNFFWEAQIIIEGKKNKSEDLQHQFIKCLYSVCTLNKKNHIQVLTHIAYSAEKAKQYLKKNLKTLRSNFLS